MTTPNQAWRDARERWKKSEFAPLRAEIVKNFTGRMFRRRTGSMLREVLENTGPIREGLQTGTSNPALLAWMFGARRKRFFVAPVRAQALSWLDRSGQRLFSKGHFIPPWVFQPKRPALQDAVDRRKKGMLQAMEREGIVAMSLVFPNERLVLRLRV